MKTLRMPLEEMRQYDLKHYDELSTKCHHWLIDVPRAINFYYDYKQINLFQRIKLAFKNK